MKLRLLLFCMLSSSLFNVLLAGFPSYRTTPGGVIVFTDPLITGASMAANLEVVTDNIIRVMAVPVKEMPARESLVTVCKKKGAFAIIPIKYNEAAKTVTTGDRKGTLNGMLQKRTFCINVITQKRRSALILM